MFSLNLDVFGWSIKTPLWFGWSTKTLHICGTKNKGTPNLLHLFERQTKNQYVIFSVSCVSTTCSNTCTTSRRHAGYQATDCRPWNAPPFLLKCNTKIVKIDWLRLSSRTDQPKTSHKCSIWDMSGDLAGQGSEPMPCCVRKSVATRALCGRALSSWKTKFCPILFAIGATTGRKISLTYRCPVMLPRMTIRSVLLS